ncbi:MAG: hypothetical protein ABFS23_00320 [Pseudomonadota bacterium]
MKSWRFDTAALMLATSLTFGLAPMNALAEEYLGEFCWETVETGDTEVTGIVSLHVYKHEGSDYSLRGTMEDLMTGEINVSSGNAEVVPAMPPMEGFVVSATMMGSNPALAAMINMTLDLSTFDGTYSGVIFLTQPSLMTLTATGAMTFIACP